MKKANVFAAGIVLAALIGRIYTAEREVTKFENHKVFNHFSDKRRYLNQLSIFQFSRIN